MKERLTLDGHEICLSGYQTFFFKTAKNVPGQVSVEPEAACWKAPASPTRLPLRCTARGSPLRDTSTACGKCSQRCPSWQSTDFWKTAARCLEVSLVNKLVNTILDPRWGGKISYEPVLESCLLAEGHHRRSISGTPRAMAARAPTVLFCRTTSHLSTRLSALRSQTA